MDRKKRGLKAYKKVISGKSGEGDLSPKESSKKKKLTKDQHKEGKLKPLILGQLQNDGDRDSEGTNVLSPREIGIRGLLKTGIKGMGYRKVAKFLLLLGKEDAGRILKHLDPAEIEKITREITGIKGIEKVEADRILEDFGLLARKGVVRQGGAETARTMLSAAFGEERARALLKRVHPFAEDRPFAFLADVENLQIALLLKSESPAVKAIILSHLEAKKASALLKTFSLKDQTEIVLWMARMKPVHPDALVKMEEVLIDRLRTQGRVITEEINGPDTLAGILKHMHLSEEETLLQGLESIDPELSKNLRERLFTIDLILKMRDKDLEDILREFAEEEIAVILKGKEDSVKEKILSNVSNRRRVLINEEHECLGKMLKVDVDAATKEFLEYIRTLTEEGKIVIDQKNEYLV
ncbi:MAG: flagellar motor switch protein FliG [Spirochaetales bacterium]|nr:flagellar motor switch protein FliG [Spirochaetales bacterium]